MAYRLRYSSVTGGKIMANINGETASQAAEQSGRENVGERLSGIVENLKENITETGKQRIETEKQSAAAQANRLAEVAEHATEDLHRGNFASLAGYTEQLASNLKNFADSLRNRSIEQLIDDTRRAARRNPELFFLGSIAAGVVLARFLKSSSNRNFGSEHYISTNAGSQSWGDVPHPQMEDVHMDSSGGTFASTSRPATSRSNETKGV
jgi:hypothetical protein